MRRRTFIIDCICIKVCHISMSIEFYITRTLTSFFTRLLANYVFISFVVSNNNCIEKSTSNFFFFRKSTWDKDYYDSAK
jgi:hypothetical protein